jgi:hypothetical protein
MLHAEQKALIHIYKAAAGLNDPAYRDLLRRHSGCVSAADRVFSQAAFDQVMAALETVLFDRVRRGEIENPIGGSRWIYQELYWRKRLATGRGRINTRQFHVIRDLWYELAPRIGFPEPDGDPALTYLVGIVRKGSGRSRAGLESLSSNEASRLIDALKDRLAYAVRQMPVAVGAAAAGVKAPWGPRPFTGGGYQECQSLPDNGGLVDEAPAAIGDEGLERAVIIFEPGEN